MLAEIFPSPSRTEDARTELVACKRVVDGFNELLEAITEAAAWTLDACVISFFSGRTRS